MKKARIAGILILIVLVMASCAAGPNIFVKTADEAGKTAGFWQGLWHGFIAFFTFIVSLFNGNVGVYELHNNGGWYNFGFILGVSIFFGGSGKGSGYGRSRRHRRGED